ncbi:MAG: helix-turn-helix transcriptional regulator [Solirubrobacterales bacterium]
MTATPHHPTALRALQVMGSSIRAARADRHWSIAELSDRAGVTPKTMARVERGDPSVAVGTYFDAAALTGVPLFGDERELIAEQNRLESRLALLPSRVRKSRRVSNDF